MSNERPTVSERGKLIALRQKFSPHHVPTTVVPPVPPQLSREWRLSQMALIGMGAIIIIIAIAYVYMETVINFLAPLRP